MQRFETIIVELADHCFTVETMAWVTTKYAFVRFGITTAFSRKTERIAAHIILGTRATNSFRNSWDDKWSSLAGSWGHLAAIRQNTFCWGAHSGHHPIRFGCLLIQALWHREKLATPHLLEVCSIDLIQLF